MPDFNFLEDEEDRVGKKTKTTRLPLYPEPVDIGEAPGERVRRSVRESTPPCAAPRTDEHGRGEVSHPNLPKDVAPGQRPDTAKKGDGDRIAEHAPHQSTREAGRTGQGVTPDHERNGFTTSLAGGVGQSDTGPGDIDTIMGGSTNPEVPPEVQQDMPEGNNDRDREQHAAGHGFLSVFLTILVFLLACTVLAVLLDLHEPVIRFARSLLGEHTPVDTAGAMPPGSGGTPATDAMAKRMARAERDSLPPARDWDYYVQVASKPRNPQAQRIANTLRRAGIPAVTEVEYIPRYKRPWYRVKAGPFPSAAEALRIRDSLRTQWHDAFIDSARHEPTMGNDQTGRILQPEIGGAGSKTQQAVRPVPRGFAVRVGTFSSRTGAEQALARVREHGYPAWIETSNMPEGAWYRVHVGPFTSREEADRYVRAIRTAVSPDAFVVDLQARTP